MRVGVVIPLYNKEKYIERALTSVQSQTQKAFEVIVVNDGSTDKGPQIVRSLAAPSLRMINQLNSGVSAARNRGIAESEADYIAFLDADDEWMPDFLETIGGLHQKYPHAGAYATGFRIVKGKRQYRDIQVRDSRIQDLQGNYFEQSKKGGRIHTSCVVIRRDVFAHVGGFREDHKMQEDVDMWFRLGVYYPIAYSRKICAKYYFSLVESACNANEANTAAPLLLSFVEIKNDTRVDPICVKKAADYASKAELYNIRYHIRIGNKPQAEKMLERYRSTFQVTAGYLYTSLLLKCSSKLLQIAHDIRLKCVNIILTFKGIVSII